MTSIERFDGGFAFLSNFYSSPIIMPSWHPAAGEVAPTVEHAFQAAKTEDANQARAILRAGSPGIAKQMGRAVAIRPGWDEGRDVIMEALLRLKFAPGTVLAQQLISTGDKTLIEGNSWGDRYWGVCDGGGRNRLGELLMKIRADRARGEALR
jgi:ribA/ribD-fused uncharacterized protein